MSPSGNPASGHSAGPRGATGEPVTLRDGSGVRVRPIAAGDKEALCRAFERLAPDSRYRRFLGVMTRLDTKTLTYLTEVDHRSHEALVALDPDSGQVVGVARYVSLADDPGCAEVAMVVADSWQGRGIATVLLAKLSARAREAGVDRFCATTLSDNRDAFEVLESLGPIAVEGRRHGQRQLTITLSGKSSDAALQTALGHAAGGRIAFDPPEL